MQHTAHVMSHETRQVLETGAGAQRRIEHGGHLHALRHRLAIVVAH